MCPRREASAASLSPLGPVVAARALHAARRRATSGRIRLLLGIVARFIAAIIGVFVGRALLPPRAQLRLELHDVLHHKPALDANQEARLEVLEQRFAERSGAAFELELRANNARLAEAIEAEHGNGPRVAAAVDQSHAVMGELQKATLAHIFAMRQLLRPIRPASSIRPW